MSEGFTQILAQELGLAEYTEEEPQMTLYGVTTVVIHSGRDKFRTYLVADSENPYASLEETSKLAAFYNSEFIHRAFTVAKVGEPIGKHALSFQIEDNGTNHSVCVLKVPHGTPKKSLDFDQLCTVAQALAKVHFLNYSYVSKELYMKVEENHESLVAYERELLHRVVHLLEETLTSTDSQYFHKPCEISSKVRYLLSKETSESKSSGEPVVCHGRLNPSNCQFDGEQLVEITDWENVHFADHAKDLTYLIISAAKPEIRRNHFLKVFRHYYYALVDVRPPKFEIEVLRDLYRIHQKDAVLAGIEPLLTTLANEDEATKHEIAHRWECALEDAYAFETGDYVSDNEDCYFSK